MKIALNYVRLWDEQPKSYNRTSITKPEQTFVYPKGGEDPSPMYDGLRTNLPHVSLLLLRQWHKATLNGAGVLSA